MGMGVPCPWGSLEFPLISGSLGGGFLWNQLVGKY